MLDLLNSIERRAKYLDSALPKTASPGEFFNAWRQSLSSDEDQAFFNFVSREIFPPDGNVSPISETEKALFEVTREVEAAFQQADNEFMRRWRSMDADAKRTYFQA